MPSPGAVRTTWTTSNCYAAPATPRRVRVPTNSSSPCLRGKGCGRTVSNFTALAHKDIIPFRRGGYGAGQQPPHSSHSCESRNPSLGGWVSPLAYLDSRFHGNDGKWSIETVKQPFLRKQESRGGGAPEWPVRGEPTPCPVRGELVEPYERDTGVTKHVPLMPFDRLRTNGTPRPGHHSRAKVNA